MAVIQTVKWATTNEHATRRNPKKLKSL